MDMVFTTKVQSLGLSHVQNEFVLGVVFTGA